MTELSDDDILRLARQAVPESLHRSGRIIRVGARPASRPPARMPSPVASDPDPAPPGSNAETMSDIEGHTPPVMPASVAQPPYADDAMDAGPPAAAAAVHAARTIDTERDLAGLAALVNAKLAPAATSGVTVEFTQATSAGMQSVVVHLIDVKPVRVVQLG